MRRILKLSLLLPAIGFVFFTPSFEVSQKDDSVQFADFAGADACASCHPVQYNAWQKSTHGRAGGSPNKDIVIAPFDGSPMKFKDATVIPSVISESLYVFTVKQKDREEKTFVVNGVVGGGHMVGGGTQGFLSLFPDGTMRFLPFDYSKSAKTWFSNTNTRKNAGWVPITEDLSLADCGDWPPNRILGTHERFANCQECHGSQINVEFDGSARKFKTRFTSLAINCESCHGPGRRHIEVAQSGKLSETADIGIRSLSTLNKDESLDVCFQCHAVKDVITPGYLPGKRLQDYYALKFPALGDKPLLPDGRVRNFAYQENHLFSDCYVNGSMTCVDCHDPHSQGYRDSNRNPLPDRFSDGQCTSCHASKAQESMRHSNHPVDSQGSRCVNCHMPYLQHPEVGNHIRFARSDHTISIPRPAFDASLGIENACQQCHKDKTVDWLESKSRQWYGEIKPHKPIVAGLLKAQKTKDLTMAARLVLHPSTNFPAAQFAGLSYLFDGMLRPNMFVGKSVTDSLEKMAASEDVDVSALALASLDVIQGETASTKEFLKNFQRLEHERGDLVRKRWALALGYLGDKFREADVFDDAITVYRKALELTPGNPRIFHTIAQAYAGKKDFENAIMFYNRSIEADPYLPLAYVNLGIAHAGENEFASAVEAYTKAIEINPFEPIAYFNLGNAYLQQGREFSAIESYRKAVELDPGLALGHFYLARTYLVTKQYEFALSSVKKSLEFDPSHSSARQMLRDLERYFKQRK